MGVRVPTGAGCLICRGGRHAKTIVVSGALISVAFKIAKMAPKVVVHPLQMRDVPERSHHGGQCIRHRSHSFRHSRRELMNLRYSLKEGNLQTWGGYLGKSVFSTAENVLFRSEKVISMLNKPMVGSRRRVPPGKTRMRIN